MGTQLRHRLHLCIKLELGKLKLAACIQCDALRQGDPMIPAFAVDWSRLHNRGRREFDAVVGTAVTVREHAANRMVAVHMHAHGLVVP